MIGKPFKYTFRKATLYIILVNFILFFLCNLNTHLYAYLGMTPAIIITHKMFWQFVTYMFMHQNLSHIFFNMLGLLFFGFSLERAIGTKEFVLFYFTCGLLSGLFSFGMYYVTENYYVTLIGASGALYAVLFAYAVFFPKSIIYIWGFIPVPAPILVLLYTVIEIGSQFLGARTSVAHMTHLFGFLAAWLYFVIRMGIHPVKIWKNTLK